MEEVILCGKTLKISQGDTRFYAFDAAVYSDAAVICRHWKPAPGMVFVDCGAGPGSWTLYAAACGAEVVAFEPNTEYRSLLVEQLELNGCLDLVEVVPFVVRDTVGFTRYAEFYVDPEGKNWRRCTTLDDFFSYYKVDRIDAVNMDVEGDELRVLWGARDTLRRFRPKLIIEVHDNVYWGEKVSVRWEDVEAELRQTGYRNVYRESGPSNDFLIAEWEE